MTETAETSPLAAAMQAAESEAAQTATVEQPHTNLYWHANAPWQGTGYGTQSALFVPLISQLGYRCAFGAFSGLKGNRLAWRSPLTGEAFPVYPGGDDLHSNDVLGAHMKHWFGQDGGLGVMLTDPWVMSPKIISRLPMLAWVPLDHYPMLPRSRDWFRDSGALPVAMSRFGETQLREEGFEPYYVPHGFNPHVFKPADRAEARAAMRIPKDAFVVGIVAANLGVPSRKSFGEAIDAFGRFRQTHPDALLYLHTKMEDPRGVDIPALCAMNGVRPMVSDQYGLALGTPETVVAALLSSFDVLLNPATGEGFGLTTLEAQACGTPCIVTDFSAMPEVAPASAGNWNVGGQRVWSPFGSYQMTPNVEQIVAALEEAYDEDAEGRQARRVSVYQHVMANYQADYVTVEHWKPVLEQAALEIQFREQTKAAY